MKPGYKTTEFWLTLITAIASQVAPILEVSGADPRIGATVGAVAVGIYTASRAYEKAKSGRQ